MSDDVEHFYPELCTCQMMSNIAFSATKAGRSNLHDSPRYDGNSPVKNEQRGQSHLNVPMLH